MPPSLNFVVLFLVPFLNILGRTRFYPQQSSSSRGSGYTWPVGKSLLLQKVLAWLGQSAPPRSGAEGPEPRKLPPRSRSLSPKRIGGALTTALDRAGEVRSFLWGRLSPFIHLLPGFLSLLVELEGDPNCPGQHLAAFLMGNMFSYPLCPGSGKPGFGWRESFGIFCGL